MRKRGSSVVLRRRRARRALALLAPGALLAGVTGCTAPPVGLTGIGVDSQGGLVGYVQVCRDQVDGASVSLVGDDGELGAWRAPAPVTGFASWSLSRPTGGWTAAPPDVLAPARSYVLHGWTTDDSASTRGVTFTREQTDGLRPGQVMYDAGSKQGPRIADVATFRADACTLIP